MNLQSFNEAERIFNVTYKFTNDPKLLPIILEKLYASLNPDSALSKELSQIIKTKKTSIIEFTRHDKRILCDEDYNLIILDHKIIEEYLQRIKLLIGT